MAILSWSYQMNTEVTDDRVYDILMAHTIAISWNYSYDEPECVDDDDFDDYIGLDTYYWTSI